MAISTMPMRELIKNLIEIGRLAEIARMEQKSLVVEIRDRGEQQHPILVKVWDILQAELDERLEEQERDALGRSIAEIEEQEAEWAAKFEAKHPEVLGEPQWVKDPADCQFFIEGEEMPRIDIDSRSDFSTPSAPLHIRDLGDFNWGTAEPTTKLHVTQAPQSIPEAMVAAVETSMHRIFAETLGEYMELWYKKHNDYGPENHAIWGAQGCVIRLTDKLMRLKGFHFDDREMLTDTIQDTWMDIIGYALIGLVIERGQWPAITLHSVIEEMKAEWEPGPCDDIQDPSCCFLGRICGKSPHGPAEDCPLRASEAETTPVVFDNRGVYRTAEGKLTSDPLEAMTEPLPQSPMQCPECNSKTVVLYRSANVGNHEWIHCGMECDACELVIRGALHVGEGEDLEVAVRRAVDEYTDNHDL